MTLADYFLSLGFLTDGWKAQIRIHGRDVQHWERNLITPFLAFGLDPFHPVVFLVIHEIADYFAPGWGKTLCGYILATWWLYCRPEPNMATRSAESVEEFVAATELKFEFRHLANFCLSISNLVEPRSGLWIRRTKLHVRIRSGLRSGMLKCLHLSRVVSRSGMLYVLR